MAGAGGSAAGGDVVGGSVGVGASEIDAVGDGRSDGDTWSKPGGSSTGVGATAVGAAGVASVGVVEGDSAGEIKQRFNPFQLAYDCDFSSGKLDPRHGVGLVVLLLAIEGSQR